MCWKIYTQREGLERCLKNWLLGTTEGKNQNFRGDHALIYSLVFVSLSVTEVHTCAANAGQSIKEVDSVVPWVNQRPTVAA